MSSTNGAISAAKLRLASARRKVRAFLEQIDQLEASDFPHSDGREALAFIKQHFIIRQNALRDLPVTVSDNVIGQMCADTSVSLARYTEVLGFILRSTNVRNAFEVHFPLKRLVGQVISPKAKLVMSSEWDFVPFTYPMNLDLLPDFVLVGGPAPESGNVLIIPLAGHEIGHSAWRSHNVKRSIQDAVTRAVDQAIASDPSEADRVLQELSAAGLDLSYLQNACLSSALRQLEEAFCDLFGLYVFGEAYLYAYEYFLAPGGGKRSSSYPSSADRVQYLLAGANALGISFDQDLFDGWLDSTSRSSIDSDVLAFADAAVAQMVPQLRDIAFGLLGEKKVTVNRQETVDRVVSAYQARVPDGEGATLAEIVTAGWRYIRHAGGLSLEADRPEHDMLNELMLKSIEVSEFLLRVKASAQRK